MQASREDKAPGLSRRAKQILAAGAAILLIYLVAMAWNGLPASFQTNPSKVAALAHQISDYDLPAGYIERAATTIAGVPTILIDDQHEMNTIWLVRTSSTDNLAADTELRQGITFPKYRNISWQATDRRNATVRGQETVLTIYAGSGPTGDNYRAWACTFAGKQGLAILIIAGPQSDWSDSRAQAFIDSMR